MSRVFGALLAMVLMGSSVRADVIPTRRSEEGSTEARRQVAERLQGLGMAPDRAAAHADGLLDREAKFFAQDASRVQRAGDDGGSYFPTAAVLEGVIFLTATLATGWYFYSANN